MPRGSNIPKNTSLTGVLHCELQWGDGLPTLKVRYLINPFAKYPVNLSIPSYPKVEENRITLEWTNNESEDVMNN